MADQVVFLGMGGTIAGTAARAGDNVGYTAGQVAVAALLQSATGLEGALDGCTAVAEQVCQIDSKDAAHADWLRLAERLVHHLVRPEVRGVVVTHGTDTLEETAYFLASCLPHEALRKPVVLTCAMRPATALAPDGPANMVDAVAVALAPQAQGVLVVCAGKVHAASQVQKVHPYRVDAFDSGEAGPLAVVEEGRVRMLAPWPTPEPQDGGLLAVLAGKPWPRVELLWSHGGAQGALVRSVLQAAPGDAPVRGLVVAGTGNGTLHRELEDALVAAQSQGVQVRRTTRCAYGRVVDAPGASRGGALQSVPLSPVKARIALLLELVRAEG